VSHLLWCQTSSKPSFSSSEKLADDSGGAGDMGGVGATEVAEIYQFRVRGRGRVGFLEFLEEALELLARAAWAQICLTCFDEAYMIE